MKNSAGAPLPRGLKASPLDVLRKSLFQGAGVAGSAATGASVLDVMTAKSADDAPASKALIRPVAEDGSRGGVDEAAVTECRSRHTAPGVAVERGSSPPCAPGERMLGALEARVEEMARECNSQDVDNALWAYAKMGRRPDMAAVDRSKDAVSLTGSRENVRSMEDESAFACAGVERESFVHEELVWREQFADGAAIECRGHGVARDGSGAAGDAAFVESHYGEGMLQGFCCPALGHVSSDRETVGQRPCVGAKRSWQGDADEDGVGADDSNVLVQAAPLQMSDTSVQSSACEMQAEGREAGAGAVLSEACLGNASDDVQSPDLGEYMQKQEDGDQATIGAQAHSLVAPRCSKVGQNGIAYFCQRGRRWEGGCARG